MTLLVDTSVWSLALRRDQGVAAAQVRALRTALEGDTIDALLAQLCIRHGLTLLTTDKDFLHAASHCDLSVWQ